MRDIKKPKEQPKGKLMPKRQQVAEVGALETERKMAGEHLFNSRGRYRFLFENMLESFAYCKILVNGDNQPIDYVHIAVNNAFEILTGFKKEDVIGKKITEVIPGIKESKPDLISIYGKVALTGRAKKFVFLFEPWGKWFTVFAYSPRKGHFVTVFYDTTSYKKAEEEIWKLGYAVKQSIDGIAIGDLEPKLTYVNEAFAEMHGYSPEEMIGMKVMNLHNEEQMGEFEGRINQIKAQGSWKGEIGHIRQDGTAFPTYMSVTLLKDDGGKPTGILAVARDITKRKQGEEKIKHLNQLLLSIFYISGFIFREKDGNILIKRVCDTLAESHIFRYAWVALLDEDKMPVATAEAGLGKDFLTLVKRWKLGKLPACGQKALQQSELVVSRESLSDCAGCPLVDKHTSDSVLTIRLEYDGKAYGLLSCCTIGCYGLGEEEQGLLQRIAGDIAFALHDAEVENQRRRAVDSLVEMTKLL